ncbi:MAG TPA: response regulator transcription factor [Bryobacteraceae bacterium]|nr:response regulator transcription factor [Bryobacteraceae bacterium]
MTVSTVDSATKDTDAAGSARVRLALLSDRVLLRESLAHRLGAEPGFDLVAECATPERALDCIGEVDVFVLDLSAAKIFIPMARKGGYSGKFLVVAPALDPAASAIVLRQGAAGIFLECGSSARLMQAIRLVASGEAWIDPQILRLLAERYPHYQDRGLNGLSEREEIVLEGLIGGLSNRKIAEQIGISEGTIKATLQHLFNKAGVRTRSQLVRIALDGKRNGAS